MSLKTSLLWVSIAGFLGVLFGMLYGVLGLRGLPVYRLLVPLDVYAPWANGLYGATFIGFSILLFFVGRRAIQLGDPSLLKALLYGINGWLLVEATFSLYYGVYFNIAVDIVLSVALSYPFVDRLRRGQ